MENQNDLCRKMTEHHKSGGNVDWSNSDQISLLKMFSLDQRRRVAIRKKREKAKYDKTWDNTLKSLGIKK